MKLESLRKAIQIKPHDSASLTQISVIVSNFVNVLKEYKQIGNLQSSSTLYKAVNKLPQILNEKWLFYVDERDEDSPDLIVIEKWLSRMAFVHEGFSSFISERKEKDMRETKGEKLFSKTLMNVNQTNPKQIDQYLLADATHRIWNCPLFKNMKIND